MTSYLALNITFMTAIFFYQELQLRRPAAAQPFKRFAVVAIVLCMLTIVFDSLIVQFAIVAYDPTKILGIYIGKAPIEDFAYPLVAALIIPRLWQHLTAKKQERDA